MVDATSYPSQAREPLWKNNNMRSWRPRVGTIEYLQLPPGLCVDHITADRSSVEQRISPNSSIYSVIGAHMPAETQPKYRLLSGE